MTNSRERMSNSPCVSLGHTFAVDERAKLNAAVFRTCILNGARIAGANLFGVLFEECKLQAVDFGDDVNLTGAKFARCNRFPARPHCLPIPRWGALCGCLATTLSWW